MNFGVDCFQANYNNYRNFQNRRVGSVDSAYHIVVSVFNVYQGRDRNKIRYSNIRLLLMYCISTFLRGCALFNLFGLFSAEVFHRFVCHMYISCIYFYRMVGQH